jgi:hypothetical protein
MVEWMDRIEVATGPDNPERSGWRLVDDVIKEGFRFFQSNPEFVRIVRREALEGGEHLGIDLGVALRPMFQQAVAFFGREMDQGNLKRFDPELLLITGYGALLSYFGDLPFTEGLLGRDPLDEAALDAYLEHYLAFFRSALEP